MHQVIRLLLLVLTITVIVYRGDSLLRGTEA
jgi:hypothetical protein